MMKRKKAKFCMRHFNTRCIERVGCILSQEKLKNEMTAAVNGESSSIKFICKQSNAKTLWKLHREDNDYVLVYDKLRHCFVTVMPYDDVWSMMNKTAF